MKANPRVRRRRGGALLEATLTLSLFYLILLSLYDVGWVYFFNETLVQQARIGARYAAVNPTSLAAAKNLVLYNSTTAGGTYGILGLQSGNVSVARNGTAGDTSDAITVTISGYQYVLVVPGWAGTYNGKPITVTIPVEN